MHGPSHFPVVVVVLVLLGSIFFAAAVAGSDNPVAGEGILYGPERRSLPNIIVFFADDMGWGDLPLYGHPTITTPNLNRLAAEGLRFTQWYSGAPLCTASRASIMTGRLAVRSGLMGPGWLGGVLWCSAEGALPLNETTIAEALKTKNYATQMIGKWHLGQRPEHLPTKRGFDHYLGIPYSNDMGLSRWRKHWSGPPCTPLPLLRNETIIEQPTDLSTLTPRYTAEAVDFISRHADGDRPFFLYMAYNHVHTPIFCSKEWCNTSQRGIYGDGVSEMDASIGSIMDIVRARGLSGSTLVIFTSDNGPWLTQEIHSGSAGLLREGKGSTWEGGIREPAIAWWPGHVPAGKVTTEVANTMDIFPTVLRLVGIPLPPNRVFDGKDISNILFGNCPTDDSAEAVRDGPVCSPHEFMFHYRGTPNPEKPDKEPGLWAVRWTESRFKQWKVHFVTKSGFKHDQPVFHNPPLLFNLVSDPGEHYPLNITSPELHYILPKVMAAVAQHQATLSPVKNQDIGLDCPKYCLCCDWNSQKKYPQYPPCTCNPNNW